MKSCQHTDAQRRPGTDPHARRRRRRDVSHENPGTSEIHFVAALDSVPEMRAILTLFEGVATGAADGYARMADAPAVTLPAPQTGLGNGLRTSTTRAEQKVPVVNIVGDHATYHTRYDTPLQSDIETVARNVSTSEWTWGRPNSSLATPLEAIAAASGPPGQVATLIVPADVSWQDGAEPAAPPSRLRHPRSREGSRGRREGNQG